MAIPRSSAGELPQTTTTFPSPEPKEEEESRPEDRTRYVRGPSNATICQIYIVELELLELFVFRGWVALAKPGVHRLAIPLKFW